MFEIIPDRQIVRLYPLAPDEETINLPFDYWSGPYHTMEYISMHQQIANEGGIYSMRWLEVRSALIDAGHVPIFAK